MAFDLEELRVGILEEMAFLHHFVPRTPWRYTEYGGLEACRRAYRERNRAKGLCVSCRQPTVVGLQVCIRHRQKQRDKARARRRSSTNENTFTSSELHRVRRTLTRIFALAMTKKTRCSSCGEVGHNRTRCALPSSERRPRYYAVKSATFCSSCGERGHNRRTCESRRDERTGRGR